MAFLEDMAHTMDRAADFKRPLYLSTPEQKYISGPE